MSQGRDAGRGRRGPRVLGDLLGELYAARGLGRVQATSELEEAWSEAVGEAGRDETRVAGLRHGVLTVTVGHPALLEELAAFRKAALLAALRTALPELRLQDLRFRVGPIEGRGMRNERELPRAERGGTAVLRTAHGTPKRTPPKGGRRRSG
jgi:predicted nucleic acid-binding Zn ribbon protein